MQRQARRGLSFCASWPRQLSSRRLLWASLAFCAACASAVAFMALFRKGVVQVRTVPTQHFKDALDDLTQRQPQLCGELYRLQAFLSGAARWRSAGEEGEAILSGQPNQRMRPTLQLDAKGVVLTSYFTGAKDPIYQSNPGRKRLRESFGYMDLWYRTASALGLPALVFHNNLSPDFVTAWASETIRFTRVDLPEGFYSVNDARFVVFLDWLTCCARVDYVLVTDLRDVRFARNPFDLFSALREYDLFVNTDRNNAWMRERFEEVGYPQPQFSVIFNAGVFGGKAAAVRDVLQEMLKEFSERYRTLLRSGRTAVSNIDMAVLNRVLFGHASERWRIFTGAPLVAGQAQCELFFNCDYFIYHKWVQPGELPPCISLTNTNSGALLAVGAKGSKSVTWSVMS